MLLQADVDRHARVGFDAFQLRRKNNVPLAVTLRDQARLRASGGEILHAAAFRVGARLYRVHADQHIAGFDLVAFLDQNGFNRAAGQVLHGLLVGRHRHRATERHAFV